MRLRKEIQILGPCPASKLAFIPVVPIHVRYSSKISQIFQTWIQIITSYINSTSYMWNTWWHHHVYIWLSSGSLSNRWSCTSFFSQVNMLQKSIFARAIRWYSNYPLSSNPCFVHYHFSPSLTVINHRFHSITRS